MLTSELIVIGVTGIVDIKCGVVFVVGSGGMTVVTPYNKFRRWIGIGRRTLDRWGTEEEEGILAAR